MEGRYDFSLLRLHNLKGLGIKNYNFYNKNVWYLSFKDTFSHIFKWIKYGQYKWWESKKFINKINK